MDAQIEQLTKELATARETATAMAAHTQKHLQRVAATSVENLADRYLDLLKQLNEKDKPIGFKSWEDYHQHVQKTREQNQTLKTCLYELIDQFSEEDRTKVLDRLGDI